MNLFPSFRYISALSFSRSYHREDSDPPQVARVSLYWADGFPRFPDDHFAIRTKDFATGQDDYPHGLPSVSLPANFFRFRSGSIHLTISSVSRSVVQNVKEHNLRYVTESNRPRSYWSELCQKHTKKDTGKIPVSFRFVFKLAYFASAKSCAICSGVNPKEFAKVFSFSSFARFTCLRAIRLCSVRNIS